MTLQMDKVRESEEDVVFAETSQENSKSDINTKVLYIDISSEEKGNIIQKKKEQFQKRVSASLKEYQSLQIQKEKVPEGEISLSNKNDKSAVIFHGEQNISSVTSEQWDKSEPSPLQQNKKQNPNMKNNFKT